MHVKGSVMGERYRVEARIGAGGMAEVFRGIDPVLNRTVAIKVLLPQFARDAGFVARFRREAQAAARLSHPNIVGVFDTGSDGDTQYIVMEFIEGRTLAEFLATGRRLTTEQSIEIGQKIASALGVAHAQGIVHRDIKPANVMVTRDGTVKVMDFGIARMQSLETAPQTSSVLGTPAYLSPEQAQGQAVDARSDLYSLGVVLYELLAGRPPFTGDSPVAIAYKQVNETPVPPSALNREVPPALDAVVMKALSKNPANRYQTAAELSADLERAKRGQAVEATPLLPAGDATQVISRPQATQVLPPSEEPKGSSRKVWLGVLIGILVVAILAGGGYLLAQSLGDDTPDQIAMPKVTGSLFDDAKQTLEAQGFVVDDPVTQETSDARKDTVLDQEPKPNTMVDPGSHVTLTIAVPIPKVKVPGLIGLTVSEAIAKLGSDLVLGSRDTAPSDQYPEPGTIIAQDPTAGSKLKPGSPVNVTLSSGPNTITLGDYSCQTFNKASANLRKLDLVPVLGGTAAPLPQCQNPQFVASQNPAPGTPVQPGSTVTLYTGSTSSPTSSTSPSTSGSASP
jgi:beta-lactam-binding protein with PASTA domain/predicted Ser/Thr protein kinase